MSDQERGADECRPIDTLDELRRFVEGPAPKWTDRVEELVERSPTVVPGGHVPCHRSEGASYVPHRVDRRLVPRTLVCHDMKNGYLADRFVDGAPEGNGYTFYRWSQIDVFVYFSHHLVTIPPLSWINVAHRNGVKVLGTFITEWDDGKAVTSSCLKDLPSMARLVDGLVHVCSTCKFDGWLINIENAVENPTVLLEFVRRLADETHKRCDGSLVLWYDSVIHDGTLQWQNALNLKNRSFFDNCDGIFLNYVYTDDKLLTSSKMAEHRLTDVYVGVDVFGRNTYGGGQYNCHVAAAKIRSLGMSMAIFAPGWTHETVPPEPSETFFRRYLERDGALWRSLWPYLYTHPITGCFDTFFYVGADETKYMLHEQDVQLTRFLHSDHEPQPNEPSLAALRNKCSCLRLHHDVRTAVKISKNVADPDVLLHHLFTCDIPVDGDVVLYAFTRPFNDEDNRLTFVVLTQDDAGVFRKIHCHANRERREPSNRTAWHLNPLPEDTASEYVPRSHFSKDATLRSYHLKFARRTRILVIDCEIVAGNSVLLCGFGLRPCLKPK